MAGFGWQELLIILAIVLVIFGGAKLPGAARAMGESIREFRKASSNEDEDDEQQQDAPTTS